MFILWVYAIEADAEGGSGRVSADTALVMTASCAANGSDTASRRLKWNLLNEKLDKLTSRKWYQVTYISVPLFVAGGVVYNEGKHFRDMRNQYLPDFRYHYDDYLQYLPAAVMIGMKAGGVKGRSSWGRMLTSDAFSVALMAGMVNGIKYSVKKMRPDGSSRNSFPSGHTATVFMTATMLHKEYGLTRSPLYSIGGYAVATATAVSRQMNNRHWLSDVLVGAGIGILSTELGYYLADLIFKDRGIRHKNIDFSVLEAGKYPSFMSMSMGLAIFSGNFILNPDIRCDVKVGTNAGLEGAWFFSRYVGIGGKLSVINSPLRFDSDRFFDYHPGLAGRIRKVYADPVAVGSVYAGPYFSYPLSSHWLLNGKITFGYSYSNPIEINLQVSDRMHPDRTSAVPLLKVRDVSGIGLNTGISVMRILNRNLGVRLFCDYNLMPADMVCKMNVTPESVTAMTNTWRRKESIAYYTVGVSVNAVFW